MANSWSLKTIRLEIILGAGTFSDGGNAKTVEGLAVDVNIDKPGLPAMNSADITIYGMKLADMAQLTTLAFRPLESWYNSIAVYAGVQGSELGLAFKGEIASASADFNSAPDVAFKIQAKTGYYSNLMAKAPVSTQGNASVEQLVKRFAEETGLTFENQGVTAEVTNSIFNGSPLEKMRAAADQAGVQLIIDDGTAFLLPADQPRSGNAFLITPDTGMIGYPTFDDTGITVNTIYNPAYQYGRLIEVQSIVPKATGTWIINKLTHNLSAYHTSGGPWKSVIKARPASGGVI